LVNGACGLSAIERFSTEGMRVKSGGEIKALSDLTGTFDRPLPNCRASQFLILAAREALQMAHWQESPPVDHHLGVVMGSALGGIGQAERLLEHPRDIHALTGALYDGPTRTLAHWFRIPGPVMTISTACASGATSLGVAADLLRAGTATAVLAGGVDILCRFVMQGFNRMRSLTRDQVRPFDRRRNGLLLGEGAGIVVLEKASSAQQRGVQPLGFLRGHASCADGSHISAPDTAGRGLEPCARLR
jgi:3-oxoacyl-[acyl-carrier-protein] synthase II